MLDQNELFRRLRARLVRRSSLHDVTAGPGDDPLAQPATRTGAGSPNENYARELMELFTLGADRGAYTEDGRARAGARPHRLRLRLELRARRAQLPLRRRPRHDPGTKTVFGKTGAFDLGAGGGAVRRATRCTRRSSCTKLWSYFIPTPPSDERPRRRSSRLYVVERLPGPAGAGGDPPPPAAPRRARGW